MFWYLNLEYLLVCCTIRDHVLQTSEKCTSSLPWSYKYSEFQEWRVFRSQITGNLRPV